MGVAPPKGIDCSWLAEHWFFLFLCSLAWSLEANGTKPSLEPGSPAVDSTCTGAGEESPKDERAATLGTAATSCIPSHHRHQNLGGVQHNIRQAWNRRRLQPCQRQRCMQQSPSGVQRHVGRTWNLWGLQPCQRSCCSPLAVSSNPHLLDALHWLDEGRCPSITGWCYPSGTHYRHSWHNHGRLRESSGALTDAVPLLMAVVALLESVTPPPAKPRTSQPYWVSRPVTLDWRCTLWPRSLRTTRPRPHVLMVVRPRPGHTRSRCQSTSGLGPRHPTSQNRPRNRRNSPLTSQNVPPSPTPHPSTLWLTHHVPGEQVAQALNLTAEEWAAWDLGNCTSSHWGSLGGA